MSQLKVSLAGTLESSDILVTVEPRDTGCGILIELQSLVFAQYGEQIKKVIHDTVKEQGIRDIYIKAVDRGALDCTVRARILTALSRAGVVLKEESLWR
ncbi:citrate lyase acyl carrier protein [Anaerospora hongkongensis]|uniref:citrate lyase acyl carrier protein n=1 Tax=Anaerospora hongkongensis TaxID=244830 RepID=UPI0028A043A5|nr:citrate lyase acyl carrier protein [Anaerospora hongkongensis]